MPHTPGGTKYVLWVSGEPKKTAGPVLRGAAKCRTLQEGPNVSCGLAVSPGKPRVPYCEERPGAAHSRRDQMCDCGFRAHPPTRRGGEHWSYHGSGRFGDTMPWRTRVARGARGWDGLGHTTRGGA